MPYRKVDVGIWEGELAETFSGKPEEWMVALYLITCRHNTMGLGFYRLPIAYIEDATGLSATRCRRVLNELPTRFGRYHEGSKTVFIVEGARHSWGDDPNPEANTVKPMVKALGDTVLELHKSPIFNELVDRYRDDWQRVFNALPTRSQRVLDAFLNTESLTPQETETDQETDQDPDQDPTEGSELQAAPEPPAPDVVETVDHEPGDAVAWIRVKGKPTNKTRETDDGLEAPVTRELYGAMAAAYPAVDIDKQIAKAAAWSVANPRNRKTARGLSRFLNSWMAAEQDRSRPEPNGYTNGTPRPSDNYAGDISQVVFHYYADALPRFEIMTTGNVSGRSSEATASQRAAIIRARQDYTLEQIIEACDNAVNDGYTLGHADKSPAARPQLEAWLKIANGFDHVQKLLGATAPDKTVDRGKLMQLRQWRQKRARQNGSDKLASIEAQAKEHIEPEGPADGEIDYFGEGGGN